MQSAPAAGRATQDGRAGASARAPHCGRSGAGFGSILRVEVIKPYQGLVRYELRCGQLYARTIVAFADRR